MAQREADLVESVHQAILAERIDLEVHGERAVGARHALALEVDHQAKAGKRIALMEQAIDLGFAQHHRQEAVLERVVEEDVGERRRDDAAKAVVHQRPWRMLARGAAAEVLAPEKNGRAFVARLVQHEARVFAPVGKQALGEAGALDRSQVLLRDDLVGVDVGAVERHHEAVQHGELFHRQLHLLPFRSIV